MFDMRQQYDHDHALSFQTNKPVMIAVVREIFNKIKAQIGKLDMRDKSPKKGKFWSREHGPFYITVSDFISFPSENLFIKSVPKLRIAFYGK